MAEIGRWSGIKFEVSSNVIRGFTDLTVKGAVETEDQTGGPSIKYVTNKARKPTEMSLTVHLDARLGCDVRDTAMGLVSMATYGAEDYFYIANKKLVPYKMKLMDATVNNVSMTVGGVWICCDIKMNLKQSSLPDGTSTGGGGSSGGGGGGGGSGGGGGGGGNSTTTYKVQIPGMSVLTVKASSVQDALNKAGCGSWTGTVYVNGSSHSVTKGKLTTTQVTTNTSTNKSSTSSSTAQKVTNTVKTVAQNIVNTATNFINNLVNAAKKASAATKTTTTTTKTTTTTVKKPLLNNKYVK